MNLDKKDRALLVALRGEFQPLRETLDVTRIKRTTAYRHIEALLELGAIEKQGPLYRTTDVGLAALEAGPATEATAPSPMDAVSPHLAACPTAVHRALLELMLAAWVARTHDVSLDAQFSFVVFGPTMRWKTWLARLFATLIGESCEEVLLLLSAETGRSVFTRRGSRGETSWQRLVLDRGCVVFDEFQDAAPDVKRLCGIYLQGSMRVAYENESILVRPVPVFTLNDKPADSLAGRLGMAEAQLRRSIPCDLSAVSIPKRLWTRGEEILAAARLETPLKAPPPRLSATDAAKKIQPLVRRHVRSELLPRIDVQRLATVASGMSAWVDGLAAVERTVECYLRVIETLGWTREQWSTTPPASAKNPSDAPSDDARLREFLLQDSEPHDPRLDFDHTLERVARSAEIAGVDAPCVSRVGQILREIGSDDFGEICGLTTDVRSFREVLKDIDRQIGRRRDDLTSLQRRHQRTQRLLKALGGNERAARSGLRCQRLLHEVGVSERDIQEFVRQHRAIKQYGLESALHLLGKARAVIRDIEGLRKKRARAKCALQRTLQETTSALQKDRVSRRMADRREAAWSLLFRGIIPDDDDFWSHLRLIASPVTRALLPDKTLALACQITERVMRLAATGKEDP